MKSQPDREARDRIKTLRVVVNKTEREEITSRAKDAGLSVSAYLRAAGQAATFRSARVNHEQVLALARLSGDQGRLGGLLKLWLMDRPGAGASVREVRHLLEQIETVQAQIAEAMNKL